jgi:hypothetical protein
MNIKKAKVMSISRQSSPIQIMIDQKTIGKCGVFQIFG